jgi:serine/threonine protein kinase
MRECVGTPMFMAPEVLQVQRSGAMSEPYTMQADMWGVLCIVICMAVGLPEVPRDLPKRSDEQLLALLDTLPPPYDGKGGASGGKCEAVVEEEEKEKEEEGKEQEKGQEKDEQERHTAKEAKEATEEKEEREGAGAAAGAGAGGRPLPVRRAERRENRVRALLRSLLKRAPTERPTAAQVRRCPNRGCRRRRVLRLLPAVPPCGSSLPAAHTRSGAVVTRLLVSVLCFSVCSRSVAPLLQRQPQVWRRGVGV